MSWYIVHRPLGLALYEGPEPSQAAYCAGPFANPCDAAAELSRRMARREAAASAWSTVVTVLLVLVVGYLAAAAIPDERPRQRLTIEHHQPAAEPDYSPNADARVFAHGGLPPCGAGCLD